MTYIVRPVMHPVYSFFRISFIFAGDSQLFVGPASSFLFEQIKVRSSTRATSAGLERTKMLLGRLRESIAMAAEAVRRFPGVKILLAGGLKPENVAEAVRLTQPYAVDVASGVEAAPGRKDTEKMARFFAALR